MAASTVGAMPIMTYPGLTLVKRSVMELVTSGEAQFQCIQALVSKFPTVAAPSVMDLSVEAEAFGAEVRFSEAEAPTIIGQLVTDEASAEALVIPRVGTGRTAAYLKAVELSAAHIQDRPTLAGTIGPFSLAARLINMNAIMPALRRQPKLVHMVVERSTGFLLEYVKAFRDAGANGVVMAEPAAGLISPKDADTFSAPYVRRIVEAVQDEHFMVVLHNCGNTTKQVTSLLSTGAGAFHFGNAIQMTDILPQLPDNRLALGNIDPVRAFRMGTRDAVRAQVCALLEAMRPYRHFVLSSGCDIPPGTPLENVTAFFDALREFNASSRKTNS